MSDANAADVLGLIEQVIFGSDRATTRKILSDVFEDYKHTLVAKLLRGQAYEVHCLSAGHVEETYGPFATKKEAQSYAAVLAWHVLMFSDTIDPVKLALSLRISMGVDSLLEAIIARRQKKESVEVAMVAVHHEVLSRQKTLQVRPRPANHWSRPACFFDEKQFQRAQTSFLEFKRRVLRANRKRSTRTDLGDFAGDGQIDQDSGAESS